MDHELWFDRWRDNRIGFHEGKPNAFLARHMDVLRGCRRVLVPLCGKAEDLAYLAAHGHEVVGCELVEDAVRAFFAEHALEPSIKRGESHAVYTAGAITLIAGDFFAVTPLLAGTIDAVYDRAALVALPPELRPRYAAHLHTLADPGSPALVVTLEYAAELAFEGPPFSVPEAEVHALFAGARLLAEAPDERVPDRPGTERCYAVTLEQR